MRFHISFCLKVCLIEILPPSKINYPTSAASSHLGMVVFSCYSAGGFLVKRDGWSFIPIIQSSVIQEEIWGIHLKSELYSSQTSAILIRERGWGTAQEDSVSAVIPSLNRRQHPQQVKNLVQRVSKIYILAVFANIGLALFISSILINNRVCKMCVKMKWQKDIGVESNTTVWFLITSHIWVFLGNHLLHCLKQDGCNIRCKQNRATRSELNWLCCARND